MSLPADFRFKNSVLAGGQGPFIVSYGDEGSIHVYSKASWEKKQSELQFPAGADDVEAVDYLRWLAMGTAEITADPQGRVRVPGELLEYAGLIREAKVFEIADRLEIWKPGEADRRFPANAPKYQDLHRRMVGASTLRSIGVKQSSPGQPDGSVTQPAEG